MDNDYKIWKPLDRSKRQIRLFILSPDSDINGWPQGRLIVRSLDDQLHYEAISYAWGGLSAPYPLLIDGIEVPTTWTLTNALAQLRHRTVEKCFWIDALCIDQNDLKDRAQQVQLMQHIFHHASLVRVWLGDELADVTHLVDQISLHENFISDYLSRNVRQYLKHRSNSLDDPSKKSQDDGFAETPPGYVRALYDLMQETFFQRLWVVQEIALARDIVFHYDTASMSLAQMKSLSAGRHQMLEILDSLKLTDVNRWAGSIHDTLESVDQAVNLLPLATMGTLEDKGFALLQLLSSCRTKEVFDPRDRIYGLLGIMTAMFGMDFMDADYGLSLAEVYTNFARRLVWRTGTLIMFNQCDYALNSTIGLPTWVPDWSSRFDMYRSGKRLRSNRHFRLFHRIWQQGELKVLDAKYSGLVLHLRGFVFDSITVICAKWYRNMTRSNKRILLSDWLASCEKLTGTFAKTVFMDHTGNQRPAKVTLQECYEALETPESSRSKAQAGILADLDISLARRRFVVTSNGRIGLVPFDTRPGDQLAILAGGNVPYVLRTRHDDPQLFAFIGECYIDGVMDGELMQPRQGGRSYPFRSILLA